MGVLLTLLAAFAGSPHLVVVSLDTTRADALSCYGTPQPMVDARPAEPRTPFLDGLAAEGVRFARFFAQTPTTLSSHATLFTGRGPHGHGVVRNGFPLDPGIPTLAERLAGQGYDTRGVVGAAALEGDTGIQRGFALWDDASPTLRGLMYQAPADEVVGRALSAVDARASDRPLFLFVHFFDAHSPYEPPEPFRSRFLDPGYTGPWRDPESRPRQVAQGLVQGRSHAPEHAKAINGRYYGEAAWLDVQVERLVDGLRARGILDDALLVVVGDHGEVLSERPEFGWSHGNDVSDGVLHVPLILKAYGDVPLARSTVVERQAAMEHLAPTLEVALGLEPTLGQPVWDLVRPGPVLDVEGWPEHPTRTIFQEATKPRGQESQDAWNNLPFERAVRAGGHVVRAFPLRGRAPEVIEGDPALLAVLQPMLERWDATAPPHQDAEMADHQRRALEALGYLSDDDP
ncbi:MAG: sulfatase [Myxococcales bacterium]|nr:sulfatase [Myxococcales bacterium]MCB9669662.1 sulfatase [Alphaproteobacteria bacterium]